MDRHKVNALVADARRAIDNNDHTDKGWDRVHRATALVLDATNDPAGMTASDIADVRAIHADLLWDCDCKVCEVAS